MSNRTNNMRDIISSVRDLQDLGDLVNGRNVYNININYYENYNNYNTHNNSDRGESLDVNDSISDEDSLILSDEGGGASTNTSDTDGVMDDIDSGREMDIDSPTPRVNNPMPTTIRTDLACPSGHRLDYINSLNSSVRCYSCREIINSRFYRCIQPSCNIEVCANCVNAGRYYRTRSSMYNPDDYITRYRYNVPRPSGAYVSNYSMNNTTDIAANTPLSHSHSNNELPSLSSLNNISNLIGTSLTDSITNTLTDIITNGEVQSNLASENITVTIGEMSALIPTGLTVKDMVEKTRLLIYNNITEPENKCHICNEEYKSDDICRKIENCRHYYHSDCIDNWFITNKNCPICNQNV